MTEQQIPAEVTEEPQEDPETFPADYVRELRQEAAENRKKAQEATQQMDTLRDAYRAALLREASAGILHEPIQWDDSMSDPETGLPDPERVAEAVAKVAEEKPWLSRPRGDIGQGHRGDDSDAAVNLAEMMRG